MSASEKLKALDRAIRVNFPTPTEADYRRARGAESLARAALPQIVAVVEAGEHVEHVENVGTGEEWLDGVQHMRAALAALDEALGSA